MPWARVDALSDGDTEDRPAFLPRQLHIRDSKFRHSGGILRPPRGVDETSSERGAIALRHCGMRVASQEACVSVAAMEVADADPVSNEVSAG